MRPAPDSELRRKIVHCSRGHPPTLAVASKVSRKAPISSTPSWNCAGSAWEYKEVVLSRVGVVLPKPASESSSPVAQLVPESASPAVQLVYFVLPLFLVHPSWP